MAADGCLFCAIELVRGKRGPSPLYCSTACRMAAYHDRRTLRGLLKQWASRRAARVRSETERGATFAQAQKLANVAWPHPYVLDLGPLAPLSDYLRLRETR